MTPRQAGNILTWCVLAPIAIIVWICVLMLPQRDQAPKFQARLPSPPPPTAKFDGVICPIVAPCWRDGVPIKGAL
jgi:hypothetical protein